MSANTSWYLWNFRAGLIRRLLDEGHEVTVLAPLDKTSSQLTRIGCNVTEISILSRNTNVLLEIWLAIKFAYYFATSRPDTYMAFTIKPVLYGGLAARIFRVPAVFTITGLGTAFIRDTIITRLVEYLYRQSIGGAIKVFFQNKTDQKLFLDRNLAQVDQTEQVPGSGIDLIRFSYRKPRKRKPSDGMVFLMAARILKDKGVVEFVQAANRIHKKYPSTRFILAGSTNVDNPTAVKLEEVTKWATEGAIEYVGHVDDITPLMEDADCVVLPSYREGLSRTLLEASAMGRPIVTTAVPGCIDVVEDLITGLLCRPRDAEDLADKIEKFITLSINERESMGLNGRQKVEKEFREEIVIDRYINVLCEISS